VTQNSEVYLDWGPDLPVSYERNLIVAMVRDPECVVFYWDVAPECADGPLVARVHCLSTGVHYDLDLPQFRSPWHLGVDSNQGYRFSLHLRQPDGGLKLLAESEEVCLPVRHVWQAGQEPAEALLAERRPFTHAPGHTGGADWPDTKPGSGPPPQAAPAPPSRSFGGSYVNFGEGQ